MDCSSNPNNIMKYQNDPEIMNVFMKLATMFPGATGRRHADGRYAEHAEPAVMKRSESPGSKPARGERRRSERRLREGLNSAGRASCQCRPHSFRISSRPIVTTRGPPWLARPRRPTARRSAPFPRQMSLHAGELANVRISSMSAALDNSRRHRSPFAFRTSPSSASARRRSAAATAPGEGLLRDVGVLEGSLLANVRRKSHQIFRADEDIFHLTQSIFGDDGREGVGGAVDHHLAVRREHSRRKSRRHRGRAVRVSRKEIAQTRALATLRAAEFHRGDELRVRGWRGGYE